MIANAINLKAETTCNKVKLLSFPFVRMPQSLNIQEYQFFEKLTALPFVESILLFGSRARGDNQERADIDIAIVCPKATWEDWLLVTDIIDEADTLLEIDCVRLDGLKDDSDFKNAIFRRQII